MRRRLAIPPQLTTHYIKRIIIQIAAIPLQVPITSPLAQKSRCKRDNRTIKQLRFTGQKRELAH